MHKRVALQTGVAFFLLLAAMQGCGGGGDSQSQPDRRFLSLGTAPPGGAFFPVGGALGEVLNQFKGENNWQASAEATKGSQENIRRLTSQELDFALSNAAITYFAVRGEGNWDRAHAVRAVMTLAPNVALFITPKSSGLEAISGFKGRRVVLGPAGAGFDDFLEPLLDAHGLSYDDFSPLYNTQTGAVDMLADGSASAAFLGGAVPTASIIQAASSQEIFFVPFDPQAREQLIAGYPFFEAADIPAGTYPGQDEVFQGLNVGSMHLITRAGQDEELVYQVTKTLYENRQRVVERHAAGRAINPGNIVRSTGTEFHPGAVRYYREIGIWLGE